MVKNNRTGAARQEQQNRNGEALGFPPFLVAGCTLCGAVHKVPRPRPAEATYTLAVYSILQYYYRTVQHSVLLLPRTNSLLSKMPGNACDDTVPSIHFLNWGHDGSDWMHSPWVGRGGVGGEREASLL